MVLEGKIAIITGGARGIGKGIALHFAKEGAKIVITDVLEAVGEEAVREIKKTGQDVFFVKTDVTQSKEVEQMVNFTLKKFSKIDLLVNNAGVGSLGSLVELKEENWNFVMEVNAKGVFLCMKAVAKHMIQQKSGKILNIASQAGKTGEKNGGVYCASKAAVIALTQAVALELAPYKINVCAICPGYVDTDMFKRGIGFRARHENVSIQQMREEYISQVPLGRIGTCDDIAKLALFLVSENSSYMTGQAVNITGGREFH